VVQFLNPGLGQGSKPWLKMLFEPRVQPEIELDPGFKNDFFSTLASTTAFDPGLTKSSG